MNAMDNDNKLITSIEFVVRIFIINYVTNSN